MPTPHMPLDAPIYLAGHCGLVGSAILRHLTCLGYTNLILRTHAELDLLDPTAVHFFFQQTRPRFVILAAARVGGILANTSAPADFLRENLLIQDNVLDSARRTAVERLLFLASSAIYPRLAPQPIPESALLTGPLEPTLRPYALAKIAGIELCWTLNRQHGTRFLAAVPANLYGPSDHPTPFDPATAHVLPSLIHKTVQAIASNADTLTVWGTGTPRRELLYSDDLARACIFLLNLDDPTYTSLLPPDEPPILNIGTGEDVTIRELAQTVARVLNFTGTLHFDPTRPDGTPRKLMDSTRLHTLGWRHTTPLEQGIRQIWHQLQPTLQP